MSKAARKRRRESRIAKVQEAFGDYVDPTEYLYDEPGWNLGGNQASSLTARDNGADAPAFQTDTDLAVIRGAGRTILQASVNAKCALTNLGNYVVGKGFDYRVVDTGARPTTPPTDLAIAATEVVEEFLRRTKYGTARKRKKLLASCHRDGEYFNCLWHAGDGRAELRTLDPGYFITPQNARELDGKYPLDGPADWSFGVHTPDDDYEDVAGYYAQYGVSAADFEYFEADMVVHAKLNVDDSVKRGISDFYWVASMLANAAKLLNNGVKGAAVLSSIVAMIEHPQGTTQDQVESFKSGRSATSYTESTKFGARTNYVSRFNTTRMLHFPAGTVYKSSPLAERGVAGSIIDLEQLVLRIVGSNWCMPEFMISGDASNNNYASILVAGSPFVKFVEARQGDCQEEDEELLWKVLRIAYDAGKFGKGFNWSEVRRAIEVKVEAPQASIENREESTRINEVLSRNGLLSVKTWAAKEGLDLDQEVEQGAKRPETPQLIQPTKAGLAEAAAAAWRKYP